MAQSFDFSVCPHGSVWEFEIRSEAAREFVDEYLELEGWQWGGKNVFFVDHRPARDLADAIVNEHGLSVFGRSRVSSGGW